MAVLCAPMGCLNCKATLGPWADGVVVMMSIRQACSLVGSYLNSSSEKSLITIGVSVMPFRRFTSSLILSIFWAVVRC